MGKTVAKDRVVAVYDPILGKAIHYVMPEVKWNGDPTLHQQRDNDPHPHGSMTPEQINKLPVAVWVETAEPVVNEDGDSDEGTGHWELA